VASAWRQAPSAARSLLLIPLYLFRTVSSRLKLPAVVEARTKRSQYERLHEVLNGRLGVQPGATTRRLRAELGSIQKANPI
jgi:hypothetical protein